MLWYSRICEGSFRRLRAQLVKAALLMRGEDGVFQITLRKQNERRGHNWVPPDPQISAHRQKGLTQNPDSVGLVFLLEPAPVMRPHHIYPITRAAEGRTEKRVHALKRASIRPCLIKPVSCTEFLRKVYKSHWFLYCADARITH